MTFYQQPDTDGDRLTNYQAYEEYKQQAHDCASIADGQKASARSLKGSIVARRSVAPVAATQCRSAALSQMIDSQKQ
jgi:hypothetical protein